MVSRRLLFFFGLAAFAAACGSSGSGGSSTPLAPTVTPPAGCSGAAVEHVAISFNGSSEGATFQVFGKSFSKTFGSSTGFTVTEDVVPCSYEITGQMLGRLLQVQFGRTAPFSGAFSEAEGVEKGSIVVDEGPNPVFAPATDYCHIDFSELRNLQTPPFNFKIRFKVSKTNAVKATTGGC